MSTHASEYGFTDGREGSLQNILPGNADRIDRYRKHIQGPPEVRTAAPPSMTESLQGRQVHGETLTPIRERVIDRQVSRLELSGRKSWWERSFPEPPRDYRRESEMAKRKYGANPGQPFLIEELIA